MSTKSKTVFVAMSGGVDSSVAAYLLKKQGCSVVGVFMRCYNLDGCAERDAEDARRVAEKLNIPFYVWDFEEEYKMLVIEYMIDGYRRGETPNPDVACNREIKFGLFLEKALAAGGDYVATGHYVRLRRQASGIRMFAAKDTNKDQSYFLWTLTQEDLKYCLFPIGDYTKPQVRDIARRAGLPTADKKDSQGVCFLGKVSVSDFLKQHIRPRRGAVLLALSGAEGAATGEKLGEHDGAWFYTIGQRHGLVLGDKRKAARGRGKVPAHYVAHKDVTTNTVVVAEGRDNPALYKKEISLRGVNFISRLGVGSRELRVLARVRYRQPLAAAVLTFSNSRELEKGKGSGKLVFDKPVKFVAPGQSAVFYASRSGSSFAKASKGMEMLGGGVIAGSI